MFATANAKAITLTTTDYLQTLGSCEMAFTLYHVR